MFEAFLKFTKIDLKIKNEKELYDLLGGKTFLNGAYRLFKETDKDKWNRTVTEAYPKYKGLINVFGYDWLGRVFAEDIRNKQVLLFEPGTGDVLEIPVSIEEFHNTEIVEYADASIALDFFTEWFENNQQYVLKPSECAGYKVPLFLNGEDTVENLEVSDMDVYWTIFGALIKSLN